MESESNLVALIVGGKHQELVDAIEKIRSSSIPEAQKLAKQYLENQSLLEAISNRFQESDAAGLAEDPICGWFYDWVDSNTQELKLFVFQFIPIILWSYLYKSQQTLGKNPLVGIESVLLAIYNKEFVKREGKERKWTPPSLQTIRAAKEKPKTGGSVTFNPSLTEKALKELDATQDRAVIIDDVLPVINYALTKNEPKRDKVIQIALQYYTDNMSLMSMFSLLTFCAVATKLSSNGYPFATEKSGKEEEVETSKRKSKRLSTSSIKLKNVTSTRIPVSAVVLQGLINGITYALFKNVKEVEQQAKIALDAISFRANYDLLPEIMLSTNALQHICAQQTNAN